MRIISLIVALCLATSSFGAVNGRLQASIDSVAALPSGGTVFIPAGTYVTGTLRLYSGVRLHLEAGAKILGSTDPFDYEGYADTSSDRRGLASDKCSKPQFALIVASNAHNIAITGPGTIDGRGLEVALAIDSLHHTGVRVDPHYNLRRMRPSLRPKLMDFDCVDSLLIENVALRNGASWGLSLNKCRRVAISDIDFVNRAYWNNDGIDISDCHNVAVSGCRINSADDGIVLKSFDPADCNDNILIENCDVASSASAIKMGTESFGGFRNVTVRTAAADYRPALVAHDDIHNLNGVIEGF